MCLLDSDALSFLSFSLSNLLPVMLPVTLARRVDM